MNLRNTLLGLHIPIFLQGGLGTGSTLEVNSDTLRVRTKPEVRMERPGGAIHDPGSGVDPKFRFYTGLKRVFLKL